MPKKSRGKWRIPTTKINGNKMQNGEEYSPDMTGAYYGSSLEYNTVVTPQYNNAGKLYAPASEDVKRIFKPNRPFGTFGALRSDEEQTQYQKEVGRCVIELTSVEDVTTVADSMDEATKALEQDLDKVLQYRLRDGKVIGYSGAMKLQESFREENRVIQQKINELITNSGFGPKRDEVTGKVTRQKYPQELMSQIADIAKDKKAITGFNLTLRVVGAHTIAKDNGFYCGKLNQKDLDELAQKFRYTSKTAYWRGTIRLGSITIPIQNVTQLKQVMKIIENSSLGVLRSWPEGVRNSAIRLERYKA